MSRHCAIIGDVKSSRDLDSWPRVFGRLEQVLHETNREFFDDILVEFRPTVGDEFQGALHSPGNAYNLYVFVKARLPVRIYCGIGIGDIEKPADRDVGMRGTAFYTARSALEVCKSNDRNVFVKSSDTGDLTDESINTLLHFIEVLENSWTKRQRELLNYYRLHPEQSVRDLAVHFRIARTTAYGIMEAADWRAVSEGERMVTKLLRHMGSESYRAMSTGTSGSS